MNMNKEDANRKTHTFDASQENLGRLAVKVAALLRGKGKPDFAPHKDVGDLVVVTNARSLKTTGKKMNQKRYYRHSGYPGGLKSRPMEELHDMRPGEVIRKAVFGMLPKNRLRDVFLKRLEIKE